MEKITEEICRSEALKYKTKMEFYRNGRKYYEFSKKNGIYDEITKHMKYKKSDIDEEYAILIAKRYKTIKELKKENPKIYNFICYKKIQNKAYSHMERIGNRNKRCVYVYIFSNKTCYIGLTSNLKKRNVEHNFSEKSSVYQYSKENNLVIPEPMQLTEYIDKDEAAKLEIYFSNEYKKDGWKLLNKIKCGSLGGFSDETIKYTKEVCKKIALKFNTKTELRNVNRYVYNKILVNKWQTECFSHMSKDYAKMIKGEKISNAKLGKKMNIANIENFRKNHSSVPVLQFDKNGILLNEFYSANEAARVLTGDPKKSSGIISCCKGKAKTYKNYVWKYKDEKHSSKKYNINKTNIGNSKKVIQLSVNNEFLNEYNSITEAALSITGNKNSATMISRCCKNKITKAFGYKWKYNE